MFKEEIQTKKINQINEYNMFNESQFIIVFSERKVLFIY